MNSETNPDEIDMHSQNITDIVPVIQMAEKNWNVTRINLSNNMISEL